MFLDRVSWWVSIAVLALCAALVWPLPLDLASSHAVTAFGDSHVWVMDWLVRQLGEGALPGTTGEIGFPEVRSIRMIGWVPALLTLPLRLVMGPLAAANLMQLLSLPLTCLAGARLISRWTDADPTTAALLGAVWATCPTLLGAYATGELPNTQAWLLPLFLLSWDRATAAGARPWHVAGAMCLGVATAFTSPYYALALPFLAVGFGLGRLRLTGGPARVAAALVGLLVSLLPARAWYEYGASGGADSVFQPARRAPLGLQLPYPSPVARPEELLLGASRWAGSAVESIHPVSLGPALLVAVLAAAWWGRRRRGPGWAAGLLLTGIGLLLALGPTANLGGHWLRLGGTPVPLPAALLEWLGYPTAVGGMYYRYVVLLVLGLVLLLGSAAPLLPRARWWALGLLVLQVGWSVRDTGPLWPRPVEPLPVEALQALRPAPGDLGAVLELPLQGPADGWFGQGALLRAVFHGRPTSSLPRDVPGGNRGLDRVVRGGAAAGRAGDPAAMGRALAAAGFSHVLLPDELARFSDPTPSELTLWLGPPEEAQGLWIWAVQP
jgi:hypothetical protein